MALSKRSGLVSAAALMLSAAALSTTSAAQALEIGDPSCWKVCGEMEGCIDICSGGDIGGDEEPGEPGEPEVPDDECGPNQVWIPASVGDGGCCAGPAGLNECGGGVTNEGTKSSPEYCLENGDGTKTCCKRTATHQTICNVINDPLVIILVPLCGDGMCSAGETIANCPSDCHATCGNGECEAGENPFTCSNDCASVCGDGLCTVGETPANCWADCGVVYDPSFPHHIDWLVDVGRWLEGDDDRDGIPNFADRDQAETVRGLVSDVRRTRDDMAAHETSLFTPTVAWGFDGRASEGAWATYDTMTTQLFDLCSVSLRGPLRIVVDLACADVKDTARGFVASDPERWDASQLDAVCRVLEERFFAEAPIVTYASEDLERRAIEAFDTQCHALRMPRVTYAAGEQLYQRTATAPLW